MQENKQPKPAPDFSSWQPETVVKFATDCYQKMAELNAENEKCKWANSILAEANDQLRADLKDAMALVRKTNFGEGV